jgi:antitoxin MazE
MYILSRYMHEQTTLSKWGNSLAVRIPKSIATEARIREGDPVAVEVAKDGSIVLRPNRRVYVLDELVSAITPRNRHKESDWGPPSGKEIW